jgi:hypothetical protein
MQQVSVNSEPSPSERVIISSYEKWLMRNAPTNHVDDDDRRWYEQQAFKHIREKFSLSEMRAQEIVNKRG